MLKKCSSAKSRNLDGTVSVEMNMSTYSLASLKSELCKNIPDVHVRLPVVTSRKCKRLLTLNLFV